MSICHTANDEPYRICCGNYDPYVRVDGQSRCDDVPWIVIRLLQECLNVEARAMTCVWTEMKKKAVKRFSG
ncbi:hypothetical protein AB6A40_001537 [Gnathostoma spinigerum]|uniref:Uncharacterized protein n=1 Tax=Gnathostoma spinigerum TaxID=75299 RepID=A0ABD6E4D1_9BILA